MWTNPVFYGVILLLNLALAWGLWRSFKSHLKAWQQRVPGWRVILVLVATVLLLIAATIVCALIGFTILSWSESSQPQLGDKQLALVMLWVAGFFITIFSLMIAEFLHVGARAAYEELIG